jgi:hypothetical protein
MAEVRLAESRLKASGSLVRTSSTVGILAA